MAPLVAFVPLPNFTLTPFSMFLDVLRLAADEGDRSRPLRFRWTILSKDLNPVRSSCGVEVSPWERFGDPARCDYVVLCGGLLGPRDADCAEVESFLVRAASLGKTIIGLCTAPFVLAQAKLLVGRQACISWYHFSEFQARHPNVEAIGSDLFVVDGQFITCSGGTSAADVAAWMVSRHMNEGLVRKVLDNMQISAARGATSPQPRPIVADAVTDDVVRRAVLVLEERKDRSFSSAALARAIGVSTRQLERRFLVATGMTPGRFAMQLRLSYADWMIATTQSSITEVASACGFADPAHLARRYRERFGISPSSRRRRPANYLASEGRPYPASEVDAALR